MLVSQNISNNLRLTFADTLINTFIPIGLFLLLFAILKTSTKEKIHYFKESLNYKKLLKVVLFIFALIWPINTLASFFSIENITILIILLLAFLFQEVEKFFSGKTLTVIITILILLRLFFDKSIFYKETWISFIYYILVFIIIRLFLVGVALSIFTKKILIKDLKPGMMPAEVVYKSDKAYKKTKINFGLFRAFQGNQNYLFQIKPQGFSEEDIKNLKSLENSLKFNDIKIQEPISFAPFLFFGTLLQIILNNNIINYVRVLLSF